MITFKKIVFVVQKNDPNRTLTHDWFYSFLKVAFFGSRNPVRAGSVVVGILYFESWLVSQRFYVVVVPVPRSAERPKSTSPSNSRKTTPRSRRPHKKRRVSAQQVASSKAKSRSSSKTPSGEASDDFGGVQRRCDRLCGVHLQQVLCTCLSCYLSAYI